MDREIKSDMKIAVLVDAENISEKYAQILLDEVTNYGMPTYKRIYGDWTNPQLSKWKNTLLSCSFTPVQQYSYTSGKNASDSAMIIDAMDILYSGKVNGFCLVSSDSDFTRLAVRLREAGMLVLGMGETKTPLSFIKSCEKFVYLDLLSAPNSECMEKQPKTASEKSSAEKDSQNIKIVNDNLLSLAKVRNIIKDIVNNVSNDDGWAHLSEVGNNLSKRMPDFDTRNYGVQKLVDLVSQIGGFEISRTPTSADGKVNLIQIKVAHK